MDGYAYLRKFLGSFLIILLSYYLKIWKYVVFLIFDIYSEAICVLSWNAFGYRGLLLLGEYLNSLLFQCC